MPTLRERFTGLLRHPSASRVDTLATGPLHTPAAGEQPLADQPMRQPANAFAGPWWPTYGVEPGDTQSNYAKTRALFYNRLSAYRLGAGFSRPIINATSGFVGVPKPSPSEDNPDAQEELSDQWEKWTARLYLVTRNSFRDGDAFVRITRDTDRIDPRQTSFNLRALRPETVHPYLDPFTGDWKYVDIHHTVNPPKDAPIQQSYLLIERITPTEVNIRLAENQHVTPEVEAEYGGEGRTEINPWGLIPIVQFRNEAEEDAQWGTSDLEPLDPIMRAYHDTLLVGLQGIQLFAKPKIKLHVNDRIEFLRMNFPEALQGRPINFQGREVIVLSEGEDALYITADPGTQGVQTLLELLFFQIVQVSETPEFVFGTAVASSKASVSEQQVPFSKKIERKRLQLDEPMKELAAMYLSMGATAGLFDQLDTFECELEWPEVNPRDETQVAQTLKTLIDAFIAAIEAHIISVETANEFLRPFVPPMLEWNNPDEPTDEQRRIMEGLEFLDQAGSAGTSLPPPAGGAPGSPLEQMLRQRGLPVASSQPPPEGPQAAQVA